MLRDRHRGELLPVRTFKYLPTLAAGAVCAVMLVTNAAVSGGCTPVPRREVPVAEPVNNNDDVANVVSNANDATRDLERATGH